MKFRQRPPCGKYCATQQRNLRLCVICQEDIYQPQNSDICHPQIRTFTTLKNHTFARRTTATPNFFFQCTFLGFFDLQLIEDIKDGKEEKLDEVLMEHIKQKVLDEVVIEHIKQDLVVMVVMEDVHCSSLFFCRKTEDILAACQHRKCSSNLNSLWGMIQRCAKCKTFRAENVLLPFRHD